MDADTDTDTFLDSTNKPHQEKDGRPKIKHLLLSGGGGTGLSYYGALRESHKDGFWNIKDIQTMHGVSIGAAFLLAMLFIPYFSWDDLDDFFIKRPWEQLMSLSPDKILSSYKNAGIFGKDTLINLLSPIMKAVDLSLNVTMQELYEFTGIETHFYTTHLNNTIDYIDISHKTHPDWTVIDAIYSSCSLPLLFRPNAINGEIYIDGAIVCNYPLQICIENGIPPDEIFGIKKIHHPNPTVDANTKPEFPYETIVEYLLDIVNKVSNKIYKEPSSKYTMTIVDNVTTVWEVCNVLKTRESRQQKIQLGVDRWNDFKKEIGLTSIS